MTDDREDLPPTVDFSALDPTNEPDRMDARIAEIVRAGMQARREPSKTLVVRQVGAWAVPVLAAAGLVIAVSIRVLMSAGRMAGSNASLTTSAVTDSASASSRFGLPGPVVALVRGDRSPTPIEIVAAFNPTWHEATQ